jgi:hypothetical protein
MHACLTIIVSRQIEPKLKLVPGSLRSQLETFHEMKGSLHSTRDLGLNLLSVITTLPGTCDAQLTAYNEGGCGTAR